MLVIFNKINLNERTCTNCWAFSRRNFELGGGCACTAPEIARVVPAGAPAALPPCQPLLTSRQDDVGEAGGRERDGVLVLPISGAPDGGARICRQCCRDRRGCTARRAALEQHHGSRPRQRARHDPAAPRRRRAGRHRRLDPATGEYTWSVPLPKHLYQPDYDSGFAVGNPGGGSLSGGAQNAIVWSKVPPAEGVFGTPTVVAVDAFEASSGKALWTKDYVLVGDLPQFSVAGGVILAGGQAEESVHAVALSVDDGHVLFNMTVGPKNSRSGDWFAGAVALVAGESGAAELALVAIESGNDDVPAPLVAIAMDGTPRWSAANASAKYLLASGGVAVVSVDARAVFGSESKIVAVRGYSLASGDLLWQRTAKAQQDQLLGHAAKGLRRRLQPAVRARGDNDLRSHQCNDRLDRAQPDGSAAPPRAGGRHRVLGEARGRPRRGRAARVRLRWR